MEGEGRRIPIRSAVGPTPTATEALRLACYLRETERQSLAYCESWVEAQEAAGSGDADATWRRLQGAMLSAVIVSRLVRPGQVRAWPAASKADGKRLAQAAADQRASALRQTLHLPDQVGAMVLDKVKTVRDSLEHVDERIDYALSLPNVRMLTDWYLTDGLIIVSGYAGAPGGPQPPGQRAFYPEAGLLFFDNERVDLLTLEVEMLKLVHNSRQARRDLIATVPGRLGYGGGYLLSYAAEANDERLAALQQQRQSVLDAMAAPVEDRAVLWMGSGAEEDSDEPAGP